MTYGEILLWNELKEDKLWGLDFDRQRCIDNYIIDFYCKELILAVEIDGMSHNGDDAFNKDEVRQQELENFGITFIRFTEADVKYELQNVLRGIEGIVINIIKRGDNIKLPKNFPLEVLNEG